MIAKAFKPVVWVAAIGGAALSCYMLSLQVATERSELASLERRIVATRQDIRQLQTELGTRGRMQQLEQWNAEVLALAAPVSGQFLESNVSLARFDVRTPALDEQSARVQMASATTTPAPVQAAPAPSRPAALPAVQQASLVTRPAPAAIEPARPTVQRASMAIAPLPQPERAERTRPAPQRERAATTPRPLLDDSTLSALNRASRAERRGGAGN